MSDYISLIQALGALQPPVFIFGGFAEDILFNGTPQRPHGDIDVFISRDEIDFRFAQFADLGFTAFETWHEPRPGLPMVLHATSAGLDLELTVIERDEQSVWCVLDDSNSQLNRIFLPADTFHYPPVPIGDGLARIVSPLALYQIRAAVIELGVFGDVRPQDTAAQNRLRKDFLAHLAYEELAPDIRPL